MRHYFSIALSFVALMALIALFLPEKTVVLGPGIMAPELPVQSKTYVSPYELPTLIASQFE